MPSVRLDHAAARPGRPMVGLLDALPHEFSGLYWDTECLQAIEDAEGLSGLRATPEAMETLGPVVDKIGKEADEIWTARVECIVSSRAESLLMVVAMNHSSDRWGQARSSVETYVVRDADGRILFHLSSVHDAYGVFWLGEPTIERGQGAAELALAGILLFAPECLLNAWEGLPGKRHMEWLKRILDAEVLSVNGSPLDPLFELWREE